jgi:hypothetical protein
MFQVSCKCARSGRFGCTPERPDALAQFNVLQEFSQRGRMKKISLLLWFLMPGCFAPVLAEPIPLAQSRQDEVQTEERQRLDDQLSPEERRSLRGNLNEYARKAYPDNNQIEGRRRMMQERFRMADEFGVITRSEAQLRLPKLAQHFDEIDVNNDGFITRDEMAAAREKDRKIEQRRELASSKADVRVH